MSEKKIRLCNLHIGTEKTGTTTIQAFLAENSELLAKRGFLYPKTFRGSRDNQFKLAVYAQNDEKVDDLRRGIGLLTADAVEKFRENIAKNFAEELLEHANTDVLLLSNEHCHSRLVTKKEINRLKELLAPWCQEFRVIIYLRPQHELAISRYSTHIKLGGKIGNPFAKIDSQSNFYNYKKILRKWAEVFGEENIVPRIFVREELVGGDVVKDFVECARIPDEGLHGVPVKNESLTPKALEFLGRMNPYLPRFVDGKPSRFRGDLHKILETLYPGRGLVPLRSEAERFYHQFEESNNIVCRQYFPGRVSLFNPDFSKYPDKLGDVAISQEDMFEMFAAIWKAKLEQQ